MIRRNYKYEKNDYVFLKGILTNCHPTVQGNPHFDLEITDKNNWTYTVNINVRSRIKPHDVLYFIKQNYQNDIVDRCFSLDDTVHSNLTTGDDGYCLDYLKGKLFDHNFVTVLPYVGEKETSALETLFSQMISPTLNNSKYRIGIWGMSYGDPIDGVHNVHMNQGNEHKFAKENGTWQDGAFAIYNTETETVENIIFIMFQSQCTTTDDAGNCLNN
ncbi:DUF2278 family protein [Spiroplasma poulsonii]|uniref:DUF2278 family protein n=1 Tax=Spiroplasma poulsonii TaxID=2138 RepID=A0A433ER75_9MOLU|nr:DUF2278 family protein [Spiroplasma poulsonii]MBW3057648.1 DUF2278 domain-containing protein [Spiroplasma poulsonii]RUP77038.1 DUF2278 family protein [Spiroplasma poulsonii]